MSEGLLSAYNKYIPLLANSTSKKLVMWAYFNIVFTGLEFQHYCHFHHIQYVVGNACLFRNV